MKKDETSCRYEVGYGKPPERTQFQKGVSGNPKGRPRKAQDFDQNLIRESKSSMTISENGRRKRISKHEVVIKQLVKQAMTGSIQAQRMYFRLHQSALERQALLAPHQSSNYGKDIDVQSLSEEELTRMMIQLRTELGLDESEKDSSDE